MGERSEMLVVQAIAEMRAALAGAGDVTVEQATDTFWENINAVEPASLREKYETAFSSLEVSDDPWKQFGEAAEAITSLGEAFKLGAKMVDEDRKDLFFPAAATHLAQITSILKELKKTADLVEGSIGDLEESFQKRDIDGLIAEGDKIKTAIGEAVASFKSIRDGLQA